MNWWKNDNAILGIGMTASCLRIVIGRFAPENAYTPVVEIVQYATALFFDGTYLKRFWQHARGAPTQRSSK
jgi:hypothetical protein